MTGTSSLEVGKNKLLQALSIVVPLLLLLFLLLLLSISKVSASLVGEEFSSYKSIKVGSIVSIDKQNPDIVVPTTLMNNKYILGVVVKSNYSAITFTKNNSKITVATSGEAEVYVSDFNGEIKKGDFIGASWLEGVGMKSIVNSSQKLLGVALENLDVSKLSDYGSIKTPTGDKNIKISSIKIRLIDKQNQSAGLTTDSGIRGILSKVVGKTISPIKVLIGAIIFLASLFVAGLFISSSIRGSFVSIGRNPMASASIYKSLLHISGLSALVILIGMALSYVVMVV